MRQVVYTSPFIPAEWIAAHNLQPARVMPRAARIPAPIPPIEGLCPFAQAFANHVVTGKEMRAAIFTTECDQMRRVHDLVLGHTQTETFLLNVPKGWQNAECTQLYIDELHRLGRWLCTLGGRAPVDNTLAATVVDFDQHRQALRTAGCKTQPSCSCHDGFIRLALIGGPLLAGELGIFELVERHGGRILLDATETGELAMPDCCDINRLRQDPLGELARMYFDSIPAVWKRPNSGLYEWLARKCVERKVQGVICRRLVWCDVWHAEVYRLRDALQLPMLDLDVSDDGPSAGERTAGRIQAFLEMLQ